MSFTLNTKAEEAFNKSAYELIALIEESDIVDDHSIRELTGSLGEKPADDWSDISVDAPMTSQRTTNGIKIDIFELYKEKQIGLKEENYFKFKKLINNLYKIKTISDKVSTKFLHDNTFNWLLKTYKAKKADSDLITSLKEEAMSITKNYKFYFKILNLEIEKKFKIGNVEFEFIESDFFDTLETESSTSNELKEKYLGQVYCSFIAKDVEKSRGIEIALEECYKAMNVLKLFARTVFFPEHRTCYDIDTRVTVSEENEFIVRNLDESKHLNINKAAGATPFTLESTAIDAILVSSKRLEDLISNSEPNELQQMLINSIERFSEAISNKDIHRRIVDLFTIWESLLLKNDSVNIQDSLVLYGTQLLGIKGEDVKIFKSNLMSMYALRSQMVHHAVRKELDLEKVRGFQIETFELIDIMCHHSLAHPTKILLLESVDEFLSKL